MRISRTNFDRQESRRDRRYAMPVLRVVLDGKEFVSDNWSLGGFQLRGPISLAAGQAVSGTIHIDGGDGFAFTAAVVRKDAEAGTTGFQFQDMTPIAMSKLDRALARRLVSRRSR
jgi:hypothetical protein